MKTYDRKNWIHRVMAFVCSIMLILSAGMIEKTYAKIEWEILKKITLEETPIDLVINNDGTEAYILTDKKIIVYSLQENKGTDSIPVEGKFIKIDLSSDGENFFLTDKESKQISIIKVTPIFDIEAGQSSIIGNPEARVSLVAFFDYQCPYCAKSYPVMEQLLEKYPKDLRLIIKHFPLRMHRFAEKAALAAIAASKQNKNQAVTKSLFSNFQNLNDDTIKKCAAEAGLDMKEFETAMNDPSLKKNINDDISLGNRVQVRGVPALFINGRIVKNRSLDGMSEMIEKELKKK